MLITLIQGAGVGVVFVIIVATVMRLMVQGKENTSDHYRLLWAVGIAFFLFAIITFMGVLINQFVMGLGL